MDMKKTSEIVLPWELYEQGLSKLAIARRLGRNRETIINVKTGARASRSKG